MERGGLAFAFVVSALAVCIGPAARADGTFAPASVFTRAEASAIDERCSDARDFAKRAGKDIGDIAAYEAVDGEHAFVRCFNLPRLYSDQDDMRYLVLAAATAAYIAAVKAGGLTGVVLLHQAGDMATALGAETPDRPWRIVTERLGGGGTIAGIAQPAPQGGAGPVHYDTMIKPDVFGYAHALKYADVAARLQDAVTVALTQMLKDAPDDALPGPSPQASQTSGGRPGSPNS